MRAGLLTRAGCVSPCRKARSRDLSFSLCCAHFLVQGRERGERKERRWRELRGVGKELREEMRDC